MDDMDRMLRSLPQEIPASALASTVRAAVHRRHRRGQMFRRGAASLFAVVGLWLVWPGLAWILSGGMYASSAPWLFGGLDYLNADSADVLNRIWGGTFTLQNAIGGSLAASVWLGALFLCCAIFLAFDAATWQLAWPRPDPGSGSAMAASSLHVRT